MPSRTAETNPTSQETPSFAELLSHDPELSALRAEYALKAATERRAAAEWTYDAGVADSLFSTALARLPGQKLPVPRWPSGFAALAIDPEYAPAMLTVGCYEHACGRKEEGMRLLLQLTQLSPDTEDWIEIIDKAGQALMDAGDAAGTCCLYEAAVKARPDEHEFITGLGWALCRAGKQVEALPWMEKAIANDPDNCEALNDHGWALTELGRFDEARKVLEKAVKLAPVDYELPANNLKRLKQIQKSPQP